MLCICKACYSVGNFNHQQHFIVAANQRSLHFVYLQSWTKLVKKTANFALIVQATLKKTPPGEYQTFTAPPPLNLRGGGQTMSQPFFSDRATLMWGRGAALLTYHCSGQIWRSTKSFLTVFSMIVVFILPLDQTLLTMYFSCCYC